MDSKPECEHDWEDVGENGYRECKLCNTGELYEPDELEAYAVQAQNG